jgi:hypothetical protein
MIRAAISASDDPGPAERGGALSVALATLLYRHFRASTYH